MTQRDGYPEGDAATLNDARYKPLVSRRRIEHLKALAYDCGLTAEEARQHGKLTATKTWESLLTSHGLEFEPKIESTSNTVASGNSQINPINFFEWVDLSQLLAVSLASAGIILLLMSFWPRALNAIPRPVHFRIEFTLGDK
ncbi:hypothetical protein [Microcoleus sp. B7-D4]|uniref:hypothetical protein n=1 Tax=Microcoleus sp. B7-D4 TaxID=2818696 RepID=UPI002FCF3E63